MSRVERSGGECLVVINVINSLLPGRMYFQELLLFL